MKTVRIHDVDKWSHMPSGKVLDVSGEGRHGVRVEFNTSAPTMFTLQRSLAGGEVLVLLGVIDGLGALEFSLDGEGYIVADGDGDVWFFTNVEEPAWDGAAFKSFTTLMTRKARNRDQERMMFKLEQNIRRQFEKQRVEREVQDAEFRAYLERKGLDAETGEVIDESITEPEAGPTAAAAGADNKPTAVLGSDTGASGDSKPAAKKGAAKNG